MYSIFSHFKQLQKLSKVGGFGIIELLVSISIMVIISSVIMVQQKSFNSAVLLRSQAYSIALEARQIQLSAVSVSGEAGDFRSLLGLHFDTGSNQEYKIFKDADNDKYYDATEMFGKQGKLDKRFEIRDIRAVGDSITGNAVSVVFERPNFDARFVDSSGELTNASSIEIDIGQKNGQLGTNDTIRTVEITSTGQIAVQ